MSANHPLRRWRQAQGLTLAALGSLIGVTKHTVSSYETGRRYPRPVTLAAIVRVTGGAVTPADFLPASPPPSRLEAAE